ncbi:unnamed protein product [Schistosoma turkestanicum]|nr:unnamed protein product [Schistosoma turkestanicum]
MLWVIKSIEVLAILFPIMVLAMCFIRKGLDFIFTQEELKWLDQVLPNTKRKPFPHSLITTVPSSNDFNKNAKFSSSANLLQDKKISQSEEKRINITEEMSKTSIWRQLSGADINNENKKTSYKSKDTKSDNSNSSKIRHRKAKHLPSTSPSDNDKTIGTETTHLSNSSTTTTTTATATTSPGTSHNNNTNGTNDQPIVFCIDPKDTKTHYTKVPNITNTTTTTPTHSNIKKDGHADNIPLLDTPKIMINPPSNQGSPETLHKRPRQPGQPHQQPHQQQPQHQQHVKRI